MPERSNLSSPAAWLRGRGTTEGGGGESAAAGAGVGPSTAEPVLGPGEARTRGRSPSPAHGAGEERGFRTLTSHTAVLPQENIDTDQIIPARFLTTTSREGLGKLCFNDWRYGPDGSPKPDFVLNTLDPSEHRVLVAGRNFGCGSSREHAPWALSDWGFRAVISTEIADIFTSNCLKNGLVPIVVDEETHKRLLDHPGESVTVDLEACEVRFGNHVCSFRVEPFARRCLMDGVDTLGWLVSRLPAIEAFEQDKAA